MTDTQDPRGDAVARLHADLEAASTIHNDAAAARILARVQTRAAIELVEAVRDLTALVAIAVAPARWTYTEPGDEGDDVPTEHQGSAEPVQRRLCDVAEDLSTGDVVTFTDGKTLTVTATGVSEGAAWLDLADEDGGGRVWVDHVARDETPIVGVNLDEPEPAEPELPIVAQHAAIDADEDDLDDVVPLPEGGADDDFDVTV